MVLQICASQSGAGGPPDAEAEAGGGDKKGMLSAARTVRLPRRTQVFMERATIAPAETKAGTWPRKRQLCKCGHVKSIHRKVAHKINLECNFQGCNCRDYRPAPEPSAKD